jgi:ribosomal protein S18 acetylase RimI-like enzyme
MTYQQNAFSESMLILQSYRDQDHDAVWELHNIALNQAGAHAGNGPWDDDLHCIQKVYFDAGGYFVAGLLENVIVAMGALKRSDQVRGEIKRMRVHLDFQRRGFGQQILDHLENRARNLGISQLHLDTTSGQTPAIAFYRKNGYMESHNEIGHRFTLIFFEKFLQFPPVKPAPF